MNDPTNNQPTVTYEIEDYYPANKPRIVKITREIVNEEGA